MFTSRWATWLVRLTHSIIETNEIRGRNFQPMLNFRLCPNQFVPCWQSRVFFQLLRNSFSLAFQIVAAKEREHDDIRVSQLWNIKYNINVRVLWTEALAAPVSLRQPSTPEGRWSEGLAIDGRRCFSMKWNTDFFSKTFHLQKCLNTSDWSSQLTSLLS